MENITSDPMVVVIDLDLTLSVCKLDKARLKVKSTKRFNKITEKNLLDVFIAETGLNDSFHRHLFPIRVINPRETTRLLRGLLNDPLVEIKFLTCGKWPPELIKGIAQTAGLTAAECDRLALCALHNIDTDARALVNRYQEQGISTDALKIFRSGLKGCWADHLRYPFLRRLYQISDDSSFADAVYSLSIGEMSQFMKKIPKFYRFQLLYPKISADKLLLVDDTQLHCQSFIDNGAKEVRANLPGGQAQMVNAVFETLISMDKVSGIDGSSSRRFEIQSSSPTRHMFFSLHQVKAASKHFFKKKQHVLPQPDEVACEQDSRLVAKHTLNI